MRDTTRISYIEKYGSNVPEVNEQALNRCIKNILKELSGTVPNLLRMVPTQLTMKQKEAMVRDARVPEYDRNGNVILSRWQCVTSHVAKLQQSVVTILNR